MPTAIVTGSGGLVGSESVIHFAQLGWTVIGLENDMRARFFGPEASTARMTADLQTRFADAFTSHDIDVRDADSVARLFATQRTIDLVIHAAAQPSHDWAADDPQQDFAVNANGTLNLLDAAKRHAPDAPFIFCSTNKVYGDTPNRLPLVETPTRLELPHDHRYHRGIDTTMSIDASTHSVFGVSKTAADLLVQEYGRYFGMPTMCVRGGCLTGPNHAGTRLHGFLSYLMRCTITGEPYTVFGYGGKQVRDNIHSADLVRAFEAFAAQPRQAAVYNLGGGRDANCSMLEAIASCEAIAGRPLDWTLSDEPRIGDHRWWISDLSDFKRDYPDWELSYGIEDILREIHAANAEHWDGGGVKLSVVMPARNEAAVIGATLDRLTGLLAAERLDYEILVIDDGSTDGTTETAAAAGDERIRVLRNEEPNGFGHAVRAGLAAFTGDAVAIVMADGSDDPRDVVLYYRVLEAGYDCAFGSRFMPGAEVRGYPRLKLAVNRAVNHGIRLIFRHGYNDTTNAFKAYKREVVEHMQPLLSPHFNLTVEMPLKAVTRGFSYAIVPTSWTNRATGTSNLQLNEMGSRYLFIVLYVFLEAHLSRGDYKRTPAVEAARPNDDQRHRLRRLRQR